MLRFKDKHLQIIYEKFRALGKDTASELFHRGMPKTTGNAHWAAYWSGRRGAPAAPHYRRGTMAYAIWRAGADDFTAAKGVMPVGLMPYKKTG